MPTGIVGHCERVVLPLLHHFGLDAVADASLVPVVDPLEGHDTFGVWPRLGQCPSEKTCCEEEKFLSNLHFERQVLGW